MTPGAQDGSGRGRLRREVGLAGAVLLGLGSMVGTGVFVSVGIAAGVAGSALLAATVLAALVATANALSSAQLAAAHPVSGGTYEYGYLWLTPAFGFAAGWMFLLAKSASAATASGGNDRRHRDRNQTTTPHPLPEIRLHLTALVTSASRAGRAAWFPRARRDRVVAISTNHRCTRVHKEQSCPAHERALANLAAPLSSGVSPLDR